MRRQGGQGSALIPYVYSPAIYIFATLFVRFVFGETFLLAFIVGTSTYGVYGITSPSPLPKTENELGDKSIHSRVFSDNVKFGVVREVFFSRSRSLFF